MESQMKNITLLVLILLPLLTQAQTEFAKPQSPTELHSLFGEYFSQGNMDGLTSLFHEDAVFVIDKEGNKAKGRQEIAKVLKSYMQAELTIISHQASIHINSDTALISAKWEIPGHSSGTALEVMKYNNGGWVYLIDNPNGF